MSVVIRNRELPPNCYSCGLTNDGFYLCHATHPYKQLEDDCEERRPTWCPLIKIAEQAEPIPKDVVVPCGNGNVLMSEDTYDELIEQIVRGSVKIYRMQMNSKGMPDFSTAEEIVERTEPQSDDIRLQKAYYDGYQEGKENERRQLEARFAGQTEPKFDKDINVRSKTEPKGEERWQS